ncbi:ADP-ribosylglycohydrolase family protein (plasmid) [Pseudomonas luteola]|uniref:ADP-ribosylglycohydrolase family protein n=1 Tax=Pseudomonas luteola TaxID=47886 RepID=UPI003890FA3E
MRHGRPPPALLRSSPAPCQVLERFKGCLLGGAVGDALGAPVEFMSRHEILDRFGPDGITRYARAFGGLGRITDDTQMTLFTAEGLIRGWVRGCQRGITTYTGVTAHAYFRWLRTQGLSSTRTVDFDGETTGWLYSQLALHSQRAPGHTCLSALQEMQHPGEPAQNNSKGCGGVMRVAPVGLFGWRLGQCASPEQTFELGTELAALTHGHPTGALTGGVLAVLILQLTNGATLTEALRMATAILRQRPHHEEILRALEQAQALSASDTVPEQAITRLGEGWIAEEALAIAVYCALVARDFRHGVILAVNHDGDSDSTGAIAGNLLGTLHGVRAIPQEWLSPLELHDVIQELASDLHAFRSWDIGEHSQDKALLNRILQKYPGC